VAPIDAEILTEPGMNVTGRSILRAIARYGADVGVSVTFVDRYVGKAPWLVMWGVGATGRAQIRDKHIAAGGTAFLWDIGYFRRTKIDGHCKVGINQDYATLWLDKVKPTPGRWNELGLELKDLHDPDGHIVLAGIGPKQHEYQRGKIDTWEQDKLNDLRQRFPGRHIVYRPKPRRPFVPLPCETNCTDDIEQVLRGASLAVCHHSNVAVDAVLAGVPFESDDGVSTWLRNKPYTYDTRLDFVQRLANFQYKAHEMKAAWKLLRGLVG
jgi:hypothetical protein